MAFTGQKKKKNDETTHKIFYKKIALVFVIFMMIGIIVSYGLLQLGAEFESSGSIYVRDELARGYIEDGFDIPLPASAENIHYYYTSWLDFIVRIKFDMSPDDTPVFLDGLRSKCFEQPLQEGIYSFVTMQDNWWHPDMAEKYVGAEQCGNDPYWSMMIDQTRDDVWTVYIEAFSA